MPADPRLPSRLRDLRRQRGMSLRALAKLVSYSYAYISQVESGDRPPPVDLIRRIDDALGADGELNALLDDVDDLDGDDRGRLAHVSAQPCRADLATLNALATILATQRRMEDTLGPVAMWTPARGQHELAETIVAGAPDRLQRVALDVAAQYAQFTGALALATGRRGARALFVRAERMAEQAGNVDMQATGRSYIGYAAERAGRPAEMIAAARAARSLPGVYVGQVAYSAGQEARGHALRGEARTTMELLAEHRDLAEQTEAWTGPVAPWHYYRSPAFYQLERGLTLSMLARHDENHRIAEAAVVELRAGLDAMPPDQLGAEWLADPFLLALAATQQVLGDKAGAAVTVADIRRVAASTGATDLARKATVLTRSRG